jgi:hypothetical protein
MKIFFSSNFLIYIEIILKSKNLYKSKEDIGKIFIFFLFKIVFSPKSIIYSTKILFFFVIIIRK